ncbi:MAG: SAM-dependent methyltransferase [Bacteroidetes bacterium]|jgi:predicted O-methyltransferase YrrM|nr:SAM-dependent methyltransferase [Bacteroidota bacterium]
MDKLFFAIKYLNYRKLRTNAHGIHSPFVFDLYNKVFTNKTPFYAYSQIENIRKELLKNDTKIIRTDLGAGSSKKHSQVRSVKDITSAAAKSPKHAQLLFRLVNFFQPQTILEIGTSLGLSTMYLAIANSKSEVMSIEGCPETRKIALKNFKEAGLTNIKSLEGNFNSVLPDILSSVKKLDLVFFDGNHKKAPTLSYFLQCLEKAHNESIFIFDDIYWSKEMAQAWSEIKAHPKVTVTIDIFQMGIVFFRAEQAKQHFVLTY